VREREHLLAAPARLARGRRVARAAPGLARAAGEGRRDRLVAGFVGLGERGGQRGARRSAKTRRTAANRARSATLFRIEGASRSR